MSLTLEQLTLLKTELNTDPQGLNYAINIVEGQFGILADKLNAPHASVTLRRDDIGVAEILEAVDTRDIITGAANSGPLAWFQSALCHDGGSRNGARLRLIDDSGNNTRVGANLFRVITNTNGSQTRLQAISTRTGSRIEAVLGRNIIVTFEDVAAALRLA